MYLCKLEDRSLSKHACEAIQTADLMQHAQPLFCKPMT